jgi:hypothetical protein
MSAHFRSIGRGTSLKMPPIAMGRGDDVFSIRRATKIRPSQSFMAARTHAANPGGGQGPDWRREI